MMAGYHIRDIPRGLYGKISKIEEELLELKDAEEQGVRIMMLCELSDLIGAIRGYLDLHFPGMSIKDLEEMADATQRAFHDGTRTPRD